MKKVEALLACYLWVDCPSCGGTIDLFNLDEGGWVSRPLFNNAWNDLIDEEFQCMECGADLAIGKVEY